MSKQSELLMTMAALALVENEGYKVIDVRILGKEIWLNHPANTRELIRFSLGGGFNLPRQEERTAAIRKAIEKIFGERTLMYDVRFDDEESFYELKEDTVLVGLSPLTEENIFLDRFPLLRPVLKVKDDRPEALDEAQKRLNLQRPLRQQPLKRPKPPKATLIIMILCIAMFSLTTLISELGGHLYISTLVLMGAYYKTFILSNYEYWRFLTSGLLHLDVFHLMLNMYSLYYLGLFFESKFGPKRMVGILMAGTVVGSMFMFITEGNVVAVGLSGGLFALLGAIVVHLIESGQVNSRPVQMQLLQLLIINVFISLMPGIAVMAHVGGFISGVLISLYFSYKPSWKALKKHVLIASTVLLACVIFLISADKKHTPYTAGTDYDVVSIAESLGLSWYAQQLTEGLDAYYAKELP